MRRILFIACLAVTVISSCKKEDDVSKVVRVSYPEITLQGSKFYSIRTGGAIPTIQATAYDDMLDEEYPVEMDASAIDNQTPGLYVMPITATNRNGYITTEVVYIAVTDIDESKDLSGTYLRTTNGEEMNVTEVANGLYQTDDVGGAASLEVTVYFAQLNDTLLDVPEQPTPDVGDISADNARVFEGESSTTITWIVINGFFLDNQRSFVKEN